MTSQADAPVSVKHWGRPKVVLGWVHEGSPPFTIRVWGIISRNIWEIYVQNYEFLCNIVLYLTYEETIDFVLKAINCEMEILDL